MSIQLDYRDSGYRVGLIWLIIIYLVSLQILRLIEVQEKETFRLTTGCDISDFLLEIAKGRASAKDAETWIARNLTDWDN